MDLQSFYAWVRLLFYVSLGLFAIWLLYVEIIIIEINSEKYYKGLLFSMLNALIFGMYLNVCGFGFNKIMSKSFFKYTAFVFILLMTVQGFGLWGFRFTFQVNKPLNFNLLAYNVYESNSEKGILFLTFNIYIFGIIWFLSFLLESEIAV